MILVTNAVWTTSEDLSNDGPKNVFTNLVVTVFRAECALDYTCNVTIQGILVGSASVWFVSD